MANEGRFLVTVNNGAPAYQSAVDTGDAGTWAAKTISLRIVAFKTAAETDADLAGVVRAAVGGWDNIAIPANCTVQLTCVVPSDDYDHLAFVYQVGATFDASAAATFCTAVVTNTTAVQALVVVADDDDTGTITLGAAATEIGLNPVWGTPAPRQNLGRDHDGGVYGLSHAVDRENDALRLDFEAGTVTQAQYNTLRDWAQAGVTVKVDDGDTGARIGTYHGKLSGPSSIDSHWKNRAYPSLTLLVESEELN